MDLEGHHKSSPYTCYIRKNNKSGTINIPGELMDSFGLSHGDLVTIVVYKKVEGKGNGGERTP